MEKKKNSILSDEDAKKAAQLLGSEIESESEQSKKELRNFLVHIKKTYEVLNFDLNAFDPRKKAKAYSRSRYTGKNPAHAANIYYQLLFEVAQIAENEDKKAEYFKELIDHNNKLIKRLEKTNSNISKKAIQRILVELCNLYLIREDYKNFLITYTKWLDRWDSTKENPGDDFFNKDGYFKKRFSEQLTRKVFNDNLYIFGNNIKLIKCFTDAIKYSFDEEPCLILGETGTGKENISRMLHAFSKRKDNNFWAVNCGGFSETLFNSEIQGIHWSAATDVGTQLGAFLKACGRDNDPKNRGYFLHWPKNASGQRRTNPQGRKEIFFEIDGEEIEPTQEDLFSVRGTLFLDEINSIDMGLQSKLLRAIQENEVMVQGESRTRKFCAKVICASNKHLTGDEILDNFRRDLYFRISRGVITLPTLRDMKDSIPVIARRKINQLYRQFNESLEENSSDTKNNPEEEKPLKIIDISKSAEERLQNYDWPGNFRELENELYRALRTLIFEERLTLMPKDIGDLQATSPLPENTLNNFFGNKSFEDNEKFYMEFLYNKAKGNKEQVKRLGKFNSKTPVYRLLKKYDIG